MYKCEFCENISNCELYNKDLEDTCNFINPDIRAIKYYANDNDIQVSDVIGMLILLMH